MPNRNFSSPAYRYGFNGMEKDDEMKGSTGSSYTTYFRQYDPRLGRFMSMDPVNYPWQSDYAAFNNNPIYFADPSGAEGDGSGKAKRQKRRANRKARRGRKGKNKKSSGGKVGDDECEGCYDDTRGQSEDYLGQNSPRPELPEISESPKEVKSKVLGPKNSFRYGDNPSSKKAVKSSNSNHPTSIIGLNGQSYYNSNIHSFNTLTEGNHYFQYEWRIGNTNSYMGGIMNKQKLNSDADFFGWEAPTSIEGSFGRYLSIYDSKYFNLSVTGTLSAGGTWGIPRITEGPHKQKFGYYKPIGVSASAIVRVDATFVKAVTVFVAATYNHLTTFGQDTPVGKKESSNFDSVGIKVGFGINLGGRNTKR